MNITLIIIYLVVYLLVPNNLRLLTKMHVSYESEKSNKKESHDLLNRGHVSPHPFLMLVGLS